MAFLNAKLRTATIVGLATLSLAACSEKAQEQSLGENLQDGVELVFYHGKWQQGPAPLRNHVEDITFEHSVLFAPGSSAMGGGQMAELRAFFAEAGISPENTVRIEVPNPNLEPVSPLSQGRLANVEQAIVDMGLEARMTVSRSAELNPENDRVNILVTKLVVVEPDCREPQPEAGQRPNYRFSCADTSNLGEMVANPEDLRHGRGHEHSDADAATLRIQKYRTRDQDELIIENTGSN